MVDPSVAFLFDMDNTLLDHDRATQDLKKFLARDDEPERMQRYWDLFEKLRAELGYADYLGALQRYRQEHPHERHLFEVSLFLLNYPFAERVYPNASEVVAQVAQWGTTAILTDGDVVFQPHKAQSAGLLDLFGDRLLIYVHKEQELEDVELRFSADHYVLVDDKIRILDAVKRVWGTRVTTIFVKQGHYANDLTQLAKYPPADLTLDRIGDLLDYSLASILTASSPRD